MIEGRQGSTAVAERIELIRSVRVLADLEESLLARMAAEVEVVSIDAGEWLFRAGDEARTAYVIASGRFEVVAEAPEEPVIAVLRRGSVIGELALLRGGTRSASVRARRDSSLISLNREQFAALLHDSPAFGLELTRSLAEDLARSSGPAATPARTHTLAVVPLDAGARATDAAAALSTELARHGSATWIRTAPGEDAREWHTWLARAEAEHDHVVLVAGGGEGWTSFCLQEADLIVAITSGNARAAGSRKLSALSACELVVVDADADDELIARSRPRMVRSVRGAAGLGRVMSELGRRIAGRSVGVVLSGGGARAFAHVGVIEELWRSGVRIDRIAGVSLGAIVAAMAARGDTPEEICEGCVRNFVRQNPTSDYTIPLVSLIRGRKTARLLAQEFAGARIESMALPFFCTSTDLLRRQPVFHRTGPVAPAVLASLSIPGVLPPTRSGDGRLLVDGGVLDNLPVRAMAETAEGPVIAVDVTGVAVGEGIRSRATDSSWLRMALRRAITGTEAPLPSLPETVVRCMTLASADTVSAARRHADFVITPEVSGIGLLDWRRLEDMRRAGIAATHRALVEHPEILSRLA
ncbi:MAG TPA: patatin-like phospholipase family protein [Solirubrobacteraceae bacterium]|nr:patatin-like phospholipase family protein [Solirubrobacteraceae bacterium]